MTHCGGRAVSLDELGTFKAPAPTGRHFPIDHTKVRSRVLEVLDTAGYAVRREVIAVAKGGDRFFGVLDLSARLNGDVSLAVGMRSSYDKSLCLSLCFGTRVFLCDNLAMVAENHVKRKHTRHGEQRFNAGIAEAISRLSSFKEEEERRIDRLKATPVSDVLAESTILKSWERGITSVWDLADLLKEWREPEFEAFKERNGWSLYNAFTRVLGKNDRAIKYPQKYIAASMQLHQLLASADPQIAQAS
jgi:hypothetical protein